MSMSSILHFSWPLEHNADYSIHSPVFVVYVLRTRFLFHSFSFSAECRFCAHSINFTRFTYSSAPNSMQSTLIAVYNVHKKTEEKSSYENKKYVYRQHWQPHGCLYLWYKRKNVQINDRFLFATHIEMLYMASGKLIISKNTMFIWYDAMGVQTIDAYTRKTLP